MKRNDNEPKNKPDPPVTNPNLDQSLAHRALVASQLKLTL